MAEYDYIKFTSVPRFMRSQSFHHHHRPRRTTRCREDCACVSVEDWNDMVERERTARATSESLARDKRALKDDVRVLYHENQHLKTSKRELQDEVDQLRGHVCRDDDVVKYRRRNAALHAEVTDKEVKLHDLRKEKEHLETRVRELSQTVSDQGAEITQLQDEIARLKRVHKKDQHDLGVRIEEVREAWSLVSDLQRRLRDCRPFPFRPRYSFA
ncbi:hypothetical protein F5Y09DRAFT_207356 [Xylaria sp. FL1042]|nr:hypothetical protein F5Y09DRAFT_207356 [Xylaria sp. FL1042]